MKTNIRFQCFPQTESPNPFVYKMIEIFKKYEKQIGTVTLDKGLTSDEVMKVLSKDLISLGWDIEISKKKKDKIERPVFFGENGIPTLKYEIDGYHAEWRCGLEIEAGRAWMGNAIYRDIVQALVMINVDHLILAVPNIYKYVSNNKETSSNDYLNTVAVAKALYGHSRVKIPYTLTVIGY